jgi:hypothetical protein
MLILLAALALAVFANWRERRPGTAGRPALVSYPLVQMVALVVAILLVAHLISIWRGRPFIGRNLGPAAF